ncbi:hypothetical protein, partial [Thiolapillus sp.]
SGAMRTTGKQCGLAATGVYQPSLRSPWLAAKDMPQFPFPVYNPDMTDILPFSKPKASEKHRGNTLCRNGHHKWVVDKESVFDTKQGKLVTRLRCSRCSASKTRAI